MGNIGSSYIGGRSAEVLMDSPIYSVFRRYNLSQLPQTDALISLGLVGLGVFAWIPDSFYRMVGWPWVLIWQCAFGLIGLGCLIQLRQFKQPFNPLGAGLDWVVLGLSLSLILSTLAAPMPLLALQNILLAGFYGILLYALCTTRVPWLSPQGLWQGLVVIGGIAALISLVMWQPSPDMWLSNDFHSALRNRHPLGHHNFSGGYFVLVLPLSTGLIRSGWQRWVYGATSLIIAAALYATGSRGALLGAIVMLLVWLLQLFWGSQGQARLRVIALAAVALGMITLLLFSNPRVRTLVSTLSLPSSSDSQLTADGPARDRLYMAQAAVNIVQERPLTGLGPGNMGRFYDQYRPIAAGAGLKQVQQLHNTPLQLLGELGVIGFGVYCWGAICIGRLWFRLRRTLIDPTKKRLVTCIGLALLGYSISSLTDYQLENIPIALTLTVMLAALIQLQPASGPPLPQRRRRWLSLFLLLIIGLTLQFWLRTSISLWLTHQGVNALKQGDVSQADNQFFTAAMVTPWDPTPSALGAQQLSNLALGPNADPESQVALISESIKLYEQALAASPNDVWFNQNLAVLASLVDDVPMTQRAIARVVQLNPRSDSYSYYLLGLTYLVEGQTDQAISAFALEMLVNPQSITLESWQKQLPELVGPIFTELEQHYQTLLSQIDASPDLYNAIAEQLVAVRWWNGENVEHSDVSRPLLKALFEAEEAPQEALRYINACLNDETDRSACRLLKAWLQPTGYLPEYLEDTDLSSEEQAQLRSEIMTHRDLRDWLRSTTLPVPNSNRYALAFLYRNQYTSQVHHVLLPGNLYRYMLPDSFNLFQLDWPRELLRLDTLIESVRAEQLNLPHFTR